jgi:hypothetical protein
MKYSRKHYGQKHKYIIGTQVRDGKVYIKINIDWIIIETL